MSNKVELNEKAMENVMGGISFDKTTQTIGLDGNHQDYHYKELRACWNYFQEHVGEYSNCTPTERDTALLQGMLAEGLIY